MSARDELCGVRPCRYKGNAGAGSAKRMARKKNIRAAARAAALRWPIQDKREERLLRE